MKNFLFISVFLVFTCLLIPNIHASPSLGDNVNTTVLSDYTPIIDVSIDMPQITINMISVAEVEISPGDIFILEATGTIENIQSVVSPQGGNMIITNQAKCANSFVNVNINVNKYTKNINYILNGSSGGMPN